ncbi:c-type cytochrome [Thioflexithrix psekupsensis]|uniref:Cytochrome c4 n=1 Tax=Thioflexithrix psekupsensis TaxID=1570016 RepID=A0A251X828_9GAMM|nr:c-type cytochrome [Thioflexithrix psekupsensis]OUD14146.1 cytochrome c4 [Thioflexithrix psekupsensis]
MKKLTALCILLASQTVLASEPATRPVGDAEAGKGKTMVCMACHGTDGNGAIAEYPRIAGQHPQYIASQLKDFKSGARHNALMSPMAAALSEQDMLDLAAFYASQKMALTPAADELAEQGRDIYRAGVKDKGVPACIGCHGPNGNGNGAALYPRIGGQSAAYLEKQLQDYKSGARAGDSQELLKLMMKQIAAKLSAEEMKAVAAYTSGLR